jgi:hypothetical protein
VRTGRSVLRRFVVSVVHSYREAGPWRLIRPPAPGRRRAAGATYHRQIEPALQCRFSSAITVGQGVQM